MTSDTKPNHHFKDGLGYRLSRASKILQNATDTALKPYGISRLTWVVLASVEFEHFDTPTKVSKHVGMQRSAVSRIVSSLEKRGLVERVPSRTDKRENVILTTESGKKLCAEIPAVVKQAANIHLQELSPDDTQQLGHLLDLISADDKPVWYSEKE